MGNLDCQVHLQEIFELQSQWNGSTHNFCTIDDAVVVASIRDAIESLKDFSHSIFQLGFSERDRCALEHLHITEFKDYSNAGRLETVHDTVLKFIRLADFKSRNDLIAEYVSTLVTRITNNIVDASGYEEAWMHGRAYVDPTGCDRYGLSYKHLDSDGPLDWHVDKSFDEILRTVANNNNSKQQLFFLFTLKGNSTLYAPLTQELREAFWHNADLNDPLIYDIPSKQSPNIHIILSNSGYTHASFGEGSVHIAGKEYGTIHGVPHSHERLIFVISPAEKKTIENYSNLLSNTLINNRRDKQP